MKKNLFILTALFVVLILGFVRCNSKDEDEPYNNIYIDNTTMTARAGDTVTFTISTGGIKDLLSIATKPSISSLKMGFVDDTKILEKETEVNFRQFKAGIIGAVVKYYYVIPSGASLVKIAFTVTTQNTYYTAISIITVGTPSNK